MTTSFLNSNVPAPTAATRNAATNRQHWEGKAAELGKSGVCAIRVALVSKQRVLLDSLATRLEMQPGLTVVLATDDHNSAPEMIQQAEAEVALLDADLDGGWSLEMASILRQQGRTTKLLFLSSSVSDPWIVQALCLDVGGILLKSERIETVVHAIKLAVEGKRSFSSAVRQRLTYDDRRGRYSISHRSIISELTNRQLEILRHLANGDSVKEVARKLNLSPKSIDSHKYRIMLKVGVRDRVHLSLFAIREGLIRP